MAASGLRRIAIAHPGTPTVQAQSETAVQKLAQFSAANGTKVFHVKRFCPI
jgi:hypothetical protein